MDIGVSTLIAYMQQIDKPNEILIIFIAEKGKENWPPTSTNYMYTPIK